MYEINKYYHIDVLDGLKSIIDESADIVLIDPPYNIGKDFGNNKDNLKLNEYIEWSKLWMNEAIRILKPTGSIYIYGFSEILAHLSVNLNLDKKWLIWHYTNKTVPTYKSGWQRSHESIIWAYKNNPIFNVDKVRVPYTDTFLKTLLVKPELKVIQQDMVIKVVQHILHMRMAHYQEMFLLIYQHLQVALE